MKTAFRMYRYLFLLVLAVLLVGWLGDTSTPAIPASPADQRCPEWAEWFVEVNGISHRGGVTITPSDTRDGQRMWRAWYSNTSGQLVDGPHYNPTSDYTFSVFWFAGEGDPPLADILICSDEYFTWRLNPLWLQFFVPLLMDN